VWTSTPARAADKLVGIYSAGTIAQSPPWIAQEAGLLAKHDLAFELKFIASSSMATAAMLSGEADVGVVGSVGIVHAITKGATDLVFIGATKNILTHSLFARPGITTPGELKGKKIGITRFGSNTHYFAMQVTRRFGLEPGRDFTFIQVGGEVEELAALVSGQIDAATLSPPVDARAVARGFQAIISGPDLKIPYLAVPFVTRRSVIAQRPQVIAAFMRAMAEATKILHTDPEFALKVVARQLKLGPEDRKMLEPAYAAEINVLERRLDIKRESVEAVLAEVANTDPRAKAIKSEALIDRRYLEEMERSGFFDKLWAK
jgi:NitT/TauT family transport system substrate-binding protein